MNIFPNWYQQSGFLFIVLVTVFFLFSFQCKEESKQKTDPDMAKYREQMIEVNRLLVEKERDSIAAYVKLNYPKMQPSLSGLWYEIIEMGKGAKIVTGNTVSMKYNVSLLDGTVCYDSDSLGLKKFRVGFEEATSGIQQGVLLLKKGSKARFILPPHLAYGLIGDQDKIPRRSIIKYEVEVLDVK